MANDVMPPAEEDRLLLRQLADALSHDLRGPLRGIEGFARALQTSAGERLTEQELQHIGRIRGCAADATRMVDGIVRWLRVRDWPLRRTRVDLSFLADWALAGLESAHPERPVDAEVQPGLEGYGDEHLLKIALGEVLANALAFSGGKPARVRVTGAVTPQHCQLEIRDAGLGFDGARGVEALQPFVRLHAADEGAGHGLGLAVAQAAMRRHGGSLTLDSIPGQGSRVVLQWPSTAP